MILNPVIQGGGAEKVYKITGEKSAIFPSGAKPGEIVWSVEGLDGPIDVTVQDKNGLDIAVVDSYDPPPNVKSMRVAPIYYYFVMPASDVIVS